MFPPSLHPLFPSLVQLVKEEIHGRREKGGKAGREWERRSGAGWGEGCGVSALCRGGLGGLRYTPIFVLSTMDCLCIVTTKVSLSVVHYSSSMCAWNRVRGTTTGTEPGRKQPASFCHLSIVGIYCLHDISRVVHCFDLCVRFEHLNISEKPQCELSYLTEHSLISPSLDDPLSHSLNLLLRVMLCECMNRGWLTCVDVAKAAEIWSSGCLCGALCHARAAECVRQRPWEGTMHANIPHNFQLLCPKLDRKHTWSLPTVQLQTSANIMYEPHVISHTCAAPRSQY